MPEKLPSPSSSAGRSRLRRAAAKAKLDPRYRILLACLAVLVLVACPQLAEILAPVLVKLLGN